MSVDPDNPLPEASFLYRRILTFAGCAILLGLVGWALYRTPPADMLAFAQTLLAVLVVWLVLYFAGASADDVGRLMASVKLPIGRALAPPAPPPAEPAPPAAASPGAVPPWERK